MKLIILFSFLLLISSNSQAQADFQQGTVWYHDVCCGLEPSEGHIVTVYSQDTLINDLEYMRLESESFIWWANYNLNFELEDWTLSEGSFENYFRASQDSLFFLGNNNEEILYADFSAEVGDVWEMHNSNYPEEQVLAEVIYKTDTIVYNASRRLVKIELHSADEMCSDWIYGTRTLLEGVGNITQDFIYVDDVLCGIINDDEQESFCQVEFPSFSPNPEAIAECTESPVGVDEHSKLAVKFYPNPSIEKLNLELDGQSEVSIFDLQGRMVHSSQFFSRGTYELDISSLEEGLYTLVVRSSVNGAQFQSQLLVWN